MIKFDKLYDVKRALENVVSDDEMIAAVFESCPNLKSFGLSKTNEYDDNNYSDHVQLISVNGWRVDYEGNYEDAEEDETAAEVELGPKIEDSVRTTLSELVSVIEESFDYGEEIVIERENHPPTKRKRNHPTRNADMIYATSYLSKKKLPDSFFIKNSGKWAVYYALDHGRFKRDLEFKIFAREGSMWEALQYAREVIGGRLPENIENFFILNDVDGDEDDHKFLQEYIFWKNGLPNSCVIEETKT
jgi:hypothetical protein